MNLIPDNELMRRVQRGDLDQVGILFERHQAMVHAHCYRMTGSRSAADDLLQECFIRVIRFRESWEERSRFSTWLYRIVRNACLDHLKKDRLTERTFVAMGDSLDVAAEDAQTLERKEELDRLARAIQQLTPERREVILLARYLDMSYEEIAEILGCTVNNARVKLHRAIGELRTIFNELEGAI